MNKCSKIFLLLLLFTGVFQAEAQLWDLGKIQAVSKASDPYAGLYESTGFNSARFVDSSVVVSDGIESHTLSYRLYYLISSAALKSSDSIPLICFLHPWSQDGMSISDLLRSMPGLMEYEASFENVILLSFALETVNNLGTWWWGNNVGNTQKDVRAWAEDAIVQCIKQRTKDATQILNNKGVTSLNNKRVDTNRVYLFGHSMGGSGCYRIGMKHPELFAAIHAHAGFASFIDSSGTFAQEFIDDKVGTVSDNLQCAGIDGVMYKAREYTDMSWFVGTHQGKSWNTVFNKQGLKKFEPTYIYMDHGKSDDAVPPQSANRLADTLKKYRYGYSYFLFNGGHSDNCFVHWDWLANFRKNQSYLAFTNNSTDIVSGKTANTHYNNLSLIGWYPDSIVDLQDRYSVVLHGNGTTDITLRRLQKFSLLAADSFSFYVNDSNKIVKQRVDESGTITLQGVTIKGNTKVVVLKNKSDVSIQKKRKSVNRLFYNPIKQALEYSGAPIVKAVSLKYYTSDGKFMATQDYFYLDNSICIAVPLQLKKYRGLVLIKVEYKGESEHQLFFSSIST